MFPAFGHCNQKNKLHSDSVSSNNQQIDYIDFPVLQYNEELWEYFILFWSQHIFLTHSTSNGTIADFSKHAPYFRQIKNHSDTPNTKKKKKKKS